MKKFAISIGTLVLAILIANWVYDQYERYRLTQAASAAIDEAPAA